MNRIDQLSVEAHPVHISIYHDEGTGIFLNPSSISIKLKPGCKTCIEHREGESIWVGA